MIRLYGPLCSILILASCTQFPELDALLPEDETSVPYPTLINVEPYKTHPSDTEALRAQGTALAGDAQSLHRRAAEPAQSSVSALNARVEALRKRAARARGPVIEPEIRARMDAARNR